MPVTTPLTNTSTAQTADKDPVQDQLNRPLHDLRISVIDRCNFRCSYCMPEDNTTSGYEFVDKTEWLTFEEITRLAQMFTQSGVSKIRLTGGEPLIRPDLPRLIQMLRHAIKDSDIAMTTNGMLLSEFAPALQKAGLKRLTVSLNTLDADLFSSISGRKGRLSQVLAGIRTAERCGFDAMKINVVIQKGVNDQSILDLVRYFRHTNHILRFIEFMDVGNCNHWSINRVVPSAQIVKQIHSQFPLTPASPNYYGEVAERYLFRDGKGEVGFISSVTQPFCGSCTRARLSTDGKIYTCLFSGDGKDLKSLIRSNLPDDQILKTIQNIWTNRTDQYSQQRASILSSHKHIHKVEMFQIGG